MARAAGRCALIARVQPIPLNAGKQALSSPGRPLNHIAYASSDIIELAAKYTAGIVQNHPFVDGKSALVL